MNIDELKAANKRHRAKVAARFYAAVERANPNMKVTCILRAVGSRMRPVCCLSTVRRLIQQFERI